MIYLTLIKFYSPSDANISICKGISKVLVTNPNRTLHGPATAATMVPSPTRMTQDSAANSKASGFSDSKWKAIISFL